MTDALPRFMQHPNGLLLRPTDLGALIIYAENYMRIGHFALDRLGSGKWFYSGSDADVPLDRETLARIEEVLGDLNTPDEPEVEHHEGRLYLTGEGATS